MDMCDVKRCGSEILLEKDCPNNMACRVNMDRATKEPYARSKREKQTSRIKTRISYGRAGAVLRMEYMKRDGYKITRCDMF